MSEPEQTPARSHKTTRFLLTGLATLLPVVLTGYIIYLLYEFVDKNLGYWIAKALAHVLDPLVTGLTAQNPGLRAAGNMLAVLIVLGVSISVGAFAGSFIGRRIIRGSERFLLKVPFIKVIYPYVKQVTDFILSEKQVTFRKVVAVPYPREGMYSMGFVTGHGWRTIRKSTGEDYVQVFIPSSPTPVTGYVIFVKPKEMIDLGITVDEALRFSVSGGVIVPPRELLASGVPLIESEDKQIDSDQPAWARPE
jgi:uncharacterized membrane protein